MQSRYYDPEIGRFINADILISGGCKGVNLYEYCSNDPINRKDITGCIDTTVAPGYNWEGAGPDTLLHFGVSWDDYIIEYAGDTGTPTNLTSSQMGGPGPEGWRSYELANIEVIHLYLSEEDAYARQKKMDGNKGWNGAFEGVLGGIVGVCLGLTIMPYMDIYPVIKIAKSAFDFAIGAVSNASFHSFYVASGAYTITIAKYYIKDATGEYKMRGDEPELLARYKVTGDSALSDLNCDWRTYNCYDTKMEEKVRGLWLLPV